MSYVEYDVTPKRIPVEYGGVLHDSKLEGRYHFFFDYLGINYIPFPHPEGIKNKFGDIYTADAYFPDYDAYVEIKYGVEGFIPIKSKLFRFLKDETNPINKIIVMTEFPNIDDYKTGFLSTAVFTMFYVKDGKIVRKPVAVMVSIPSGEPVLKTLNYEDLPKPLRQKMQSLEIMASPVQLYGDVGKYTDPDIIKKAACRQFYYFKELENESE